MADGAHQRGGRRKQRSRQSALEEIAIAITALIRRGFPPDYAMTLTPRQIAAYLEFSDTDRSMTLRWPQAQVTARRSRLNGPQSSRSQVDQPAWLKMIRDKQRPVATAAVAALRETAANAVQEGRRTSPPPGRVHAGEVAKRIAISDQGTQPKAASRRCRPRPSSSTSTALPACSSTAPPSRASRCCGYRPRTARRPPAARARN